MTIFGWSLPPGCGTIPREEMMPPCCEECPEDVHTNCPGEDKCEEFQKSVIDESKVGHSMAEDYLEIEKIAKDAGHTPHIRAQTTR